MRFTSEQYGKTMLLKIDEPTTEDVLVTPRWIKMDMDEIEEQANPESAAVWLKTFLSVNHRQIFAAVDAALKKTQALGVDKQKKETTGRYSNIMGLLDMKAAIELPVWWNMGKLEKYFVRICEVGEAYYLLHIM